jgi:(1->4)-alpha-D-glucan 1-alpha-D-glucosylmutase
LDFSLVDPDNRRPVDFELRKKMLAEIENLSAEEVWKRRADGSAKLWLTQKVLRLRAQNKNLLKGNHEPLFTHSKKAKHIVAFIRSAQIISVVQRFTLELKSNWLDTKLKLPAGIWRDEFSVATFSGEIAVADLFRKFPFALLVKGK